MITVNIELSDAMKQHIDSRIGPGKFKDVSAYAQWLITEDMETQRMDFSPQEKARIEKLLLESMASLERGAAVPVRPGEFDELAKRLIEQHERKQAS
jgi:Arc/MetJ-type ribon-helix-helix transcriptional regulator